MSTASTWSPVHALSTLAGSLECNAMLPRLPSPATVAADALCVRERCVYSSGAACRVDPSRLRLAMTSWRGASAPPPSGRSRKDECLVVSTAPGHWRQPLVVSLSPLLLLLLLAGTFPATALGAAWLQVDRPCSPGCEERGNCNRELGVCECNFGWVGEAAEGGGGVALWTCNSMGWPFAAAHALCSMSQHATRSACSEHHPLAFMQHPSPRIHVPYHFLRLEEAHTSAGGGRGSQYGLISGELTKVACGVLSMFGCLHLHPQSKCGWCGWVRSLEYMNIGGGGVVRLGNEPDQACGSCGRMRHDVDVMVSHVSAA
eukprot:363062-Chlamydomonas_euryale.AAC.15